MESRDSAFPLPPCQAACPVRMDVRGYLSATARSDFGAAFDVIRDTNPLPSVCGRVCAHPCEDKCRRAQIDEALAIRKLKRFPIDFLRESDQLADAIGSFRRRNVSRKVETARTVAVVGSGPAGLACAHDLAILGHKVTILEALPHLGGMLRVGIPSYRLPESILDEDIQYILDLGVQSRLGVRVGDDIPLALLKEDFDAVFLALGAHAGAKLGVDGEGMRGVLSGIPFLKEVAIEGQVALASDVVVIGGGNVAIDVARCATRLGATVTMVCLEDRDQMPAYSWEVEEAEEEGVRILPSLGVKQIIGTDGRATGVELMKCVSVFDDEGRFAPVCDEKTVTRLGAENVIVAIGQVPDTAFLEKDGMELGRGGRVLADEENCTTSDPKVFAGGDSVTGPRTVIEAIAAGRRGASAIHCMLEGDAFLEIASQNVIGEVAGSARDGIRNLPRLNWPFEDEKVRRTSFSEAELGFSQAAGVRESQRCLNCGGGAFVLREKCIGCLTCVRICPYGAPSIVDEKAEVSDDACQACGICITECPERAITLKSGEDDRIGGEIARVLKEDAGLTPVIVCAYGLYRDENDSPFQGLPDGLSVIPVLCTSKISRTHLLSAFRLGASRVAVVSCKGESCNYGVGSFWANQKVTFVRKILDDLEYNEASLEAHSLDPPFATAIGEAVKGTQ